MKYPVATSSPYCIIRESSCDDIIDRVAHAYYKLVLVVGPIGSGKTRKLKEVSAGYGFTFLNLGEELSRQLLKVPIHLRSAEAESLALDLIDNCESERVSIDNTEILFESPLTLDPLKFLKQASCHRTIVATWTGLLDDASLQYGMPGHPSYRKYNYSPEDTFVIVRTEEHYEV